MAGNLLQFVTLKDYRDQQGWNRFLRWKAVTHGRATDAQHQAWMTEQAEELQLDEDYRLRVGTSERMGRVLGLDGAETPVPPRAKSDAVPAVPEPSRAQTPPPVPTVCIDYSGYEPFPDISAMLPITAE